MCVCVCVCVCVRVCVCGYINVYLYMPRNSMHYFSISCL